MNTARPVPASVVERVIGRTIEISAVPGPPLCERARGDVVEGWWRADGLQFVTRDATGNVWAQVRAGTRDVPSIVVCAHLDTVFAPEVAHGATRGGDRLRGPSVGDDSVALAALSTLAETLPELVSQPVWILATVGEEGEGDLRGVKAALESPVAPVGAFIAVEGNYLGRVCTTAVGSLRWRVEITGPGGHAWEAADAPNAIHAAARAITELTGAEVSAGGRTAVNVGRITGGEAINIRAPFASFDVDLRADDAAALDALDRTAQSVFAKCADAGCRVAVHPIGRRPAGAIAVDHPLVRAALAAQRAVGYEACLTAASTDANAAHASGVPAIAIGVTLGAGEHTCDEYIELPPLAAGLEALGDTVARYDGRGR